MHFCGVGCTASDVNFPTTACEILSGYAVLFFELSVEVGHVVESHLIGDGGNFVGSVTQLIACDSKSVVVM